MLKKKKWMVGCTLLLAFGSIFSGCGRLEDVANRGQNRVENKMKSSFDCWNLYSKNYLAELRDTYGLEEMTKDCQSDYEKVLVITKWVSGLWHHDGINEPKQSDPLYILDQVVNHGQQYRCVEYGIVISGCLNALGVDSRQISLKTEDVETREVGAGHVACEAYLKDIQKWVFLDGQWGAVPMLNDTPLSAYEFGKAIREKNANLSIDWVNNVYEATDAQYFEWIEPYLFYMNATYKNKKGGYTSVIFVPDGGKNVTVFQKKYPIKMDYYLKDIELFYYQK